MRIPLFDLGSSNECMYQHINLVYSGLALIFICVLAFMFLYNKRHKG